MDSIGERLDWSYICVLRLIRSSKGDSDISRRDITCGHLDVTMNLRHFRRDNALAGNHNERRLVD
jgi:hypothetical protein